MSYVSRTITIAILAVVLSFSTFSHANAESVQGTSCSSLGKTKILNFQKYTCIKAPRSISNPLGKKLIWGKGVPVPRTLEQSFTTSDRIKALNSLGLGKWKETDNQGYDAQVFLSTWPCIIYMGYDLDSAIEVFNNKVNYNMYSGYWVGIESEGWVVNQPYYDDKTCVRYFARNYGGRIFNVSTQSYEG